MRVLSKDERVDLHPPKAIPIDLRESFLPMQILIEEDSMSDRTRLRIEAEHAQAILKRTEFSLGLQPLTGKDQGRLEWLKPLSIDLTRFSFPEKVSTNRVYPAYGLLALDRLLTHDELRIIHIQPIPGYIYLAASVTFNEGSRGSILLKEPCIFDKLGTDRPPYGKYSRSDIVDKFPETVDPYWRGPIGDVEMCVNARCIHSSPPTETGGDFVRTHVLATPFELPPGFVIDTVGRLNELKHRIPRVAEMFRECVLNPGPTPADYTAPYDFPKGAPELNDERRWIFSKRPWFVQHILLSRIIGGNYWKSNLIKYELADKEL
jgi:hypothetical protein